MTRSFSHMTDEPVALRKHFLQSSCTMGSHITPTTAASHHACIAPASCTPTHLHAFTLCGQRRCTI